MKKQSLTHSLPRINMQYSNNKRLFNNANFDQKHSKSEFHEKLKWIFEIKQLNIGHK